MMAAAIELRPPAIIDVSLVRYEAACRALVEAKAVDEVKGIPTRRWRCVCTMNRALSDGLTEAELAEAHRQN